MKTISLKDQSELTIRFATPTDAPLILTLIKELAEYEKLSQDVVATVESLSASLFGERKSAEVLIARKDKDAVGFALFFHNYSTFLAKPGIYLEDLYVRSEVRGFGIGQILLSTLAELAVERGCGRLEWSVLNWNKSAIGFYEKLGAKPMNEWTVYRLTGDALRSMAQKS